MFARDVAALANISLSDGCDLTTVGDLYRVPELAALLDGLDEPRLRNKFEAFRAHVLMARGYRPESCGVVANVYRAKSGHPNRSRGWGALARGGLKVHDIAGDHYSIMTAPASDRLVAAINRDLGSEMDERTAIAVNGRWLG
jgi:hypothetical protein